MAVLPAGDALPPSLRHSAWHGACSGSEASHGETGRDGGDVGWGRCGGRSGGQNPGNVVAGDRALTHDGGQDVSHDVTGQEVEVERRRGESKAAEQPEVCRAATAP